MCKASGISQPRLFYSLNSYGQMLSGCFFFFFGLFGFFVFVFFFVVRLSLVRLLSIIQKQEPCEVFAPNILIF